MKSLVPRRWRQDLEHPLSTFQREMNRLWDSFFSEGAPWQGEWAPTVDVSETEGSVVVKAEVPGMERDDIEVSLTGDTLTIQGEKKDERKESKGSYRLVERRYGTFSRTIPVPQGIEADKVTAEFKNGVLTINLPKTEETRTKKIQIQEKAH